MATRPASHQASFGLRKAIFALTEDEYKTRLTQMERVEYDWGKQVFRALMPTTTPQEAQKALIAAIDIARNSGLPERFRAHAVDMYLGVSCREVLRGRRFGKA